MKKTKRIFIIAFLLCMLVYVCKIDNIPNKIILYNGENPRICDFLGISLNYNTVLASSDIEESKIEKNSTVDVKLFWIFKIKEVSVSVIEEKSVIPIGQISGLKLYTNGVLVVGLSEIKGENNNKYKPYEKTDIKEGDRIIRIDGVDIRDTNHLTRNCKFIFRKRIRNRIYKK